jgi:hypothetical protein
MFTSKRPRRTVPLALEPAPDTAIAASADPADAAAPVVPEPALPATEEALPKTDAEDAPPAAKPIV